MLIFSPAMVFNSEHFSKSTAGASGKFCVTGTTVEQAVIKNASAI
jgi:hypothetical protein